MDIEINLSGTVKSITDKTWGKNQSVSFILNVPNYGDIVAYAPFFFAIQEQDIVTGKAMYNQQNKTLCYTELPFVQIPVSKEYIKRCFIIALRGSGFGEISAEKLYSIFLEIGKKIKIKNNDNDDKKEEELVIMSISDISSKYNRTKEVSLLTHITGKAKESELTVSEGQIKALFIWWHQNRAIRRLYLIGLNNGEIEDCNKLLKAAGVLQKKTYGMDELYQICITNPFSLATLSMDKAKVLAKTFNLSISEENIECGTIVRYIHEQSVRNAWTCTPQWIITKRFPTFSVWYDVLIEKYYAFSEYNCWYLAYQYIVEKQISMFITELITKSVALGENKIENLPTVDTTAIESATYTCSSLIEEQKIAIQGALQNHICVITGGPGTGKTAVIKEILNNLKLRKIPHMCGSFTGKAVSRLKEVTGDSSNFTLDRMIAQHSLISSFEHLVIDETSMVTSELLYRFIKSFPKNFRITFVGDPDQLDTVTWGCLFSALIKCGKIPIYRLFVNHRILSHNGNNNDRYILNNANALVNPNRDLDLPFEFDSGPGFYLVDSDIGLVTTILQQLNHYKVNVDDITCITPFNQKLKDVNEIFQQIFLPDRDSIRYEETTWCVNDRVMMKNNNYTIDVMNGEVGTVTKVESTSIFVKFDSNDKEAAEYEFKFDGRRKGRTRMGEALEENIEDSELLIDDLLHCFCLTVHKSQGSEYTYVIIYLPDVKVSNFLNINLLYTAITRTKNTCWIVAPKHILDHIVNCKAPHRYDNLLLRLRELNKNVTKFEPIIYSDDNPFDEIEHVYPDD
jgi:hypothetical protein